MSDNLSQDIIAVLNAQSQSTKNQPANKSNNSVAQTLKTIHKAEMVLKAPKTLDESLDQDIKQKD